MSVFHRNTLAYLIAVAISSCNGDKSEEKDQDPTTVQDQMLPTEVTTVEAKRKPFEYLIRTNGKIESRREIQVQFNIGGIVSKILPKNSQHVNRGDLLAAIENQKYLLDAEKAEVFLKEKKIVYEDQIAGFKSQDEEKLKVIRENILYSSGLASAEVSYKQAKLDYENTFIRASIDGVVTNLSTKEGSSVKAGDVLCMIHDPNDLIVSCEVLEADAFHISPGQSAEIEPLFETDVMFRGKIVSINPRVDLKTGLVKIQIAIGKQKNLLPGMNVNVVVKVPYEKNLIVPKEAIVMRSGKQVAFTLEAGLAKWNYVVTGRENGKEIEILEGLKENQKVIVTNNLQLSNDAPVSEVSKIDARVH